MENSFDDSNVSDLYDDFKASKLSLPAFAKSRKLPYMQLKRAFRSMPDFDLWNDIASEERQLLLDEYHQSGLSLEDFSTAKQIHHETLTSWLNQEKEHGTRRLENEWQNLVEEFLASDFLTMSAFARSKGLRPDRFKYWLGKFDPESNWKNQGARVRRRMVNEFAASSLTAPQFASSKSIKPGTFELWLRELDPDRKIKNRMAYRILSPQQQTDLIAEFRESGNSMKDFSEARGINNATFSTWVRNAKLMLGNST